MENFFKNPQELNKAIQISFTYEIYLKSELLLLKKVLKL